MKMKKRLFAILLALCVTFTMMPLGTGGAAYAEDGIAANAVVTRTTMLDLTSTDGKYMATNGKKTTVDFTKNSVTDSAEGWSWNHETKTLTLSGARIVVEGTDNVESNCYGIFLPADSVTIVLEEGTESFVQAGDAVGEDIGGTIFSSNGIGNQYAYNGQLTICGSGKLIAKGGKLDNSNHLKKGQRTSAGIFFYAPKGIVMEENAVVEAYGGECSSSFSGAYSEGIMSQTVKITDNAKITARGGAVCGFGHRSSFGMRVSTDLVIDGNAIVKCHGGNVTKQGDSPTEYSCSAGIHTPKLSFSADARVYAFGGESRNQAEYSAGIYLYGSGNSSLDAKLSGNAFLHAEGGISEYSNYGIAARPDKSRTPTLTVSENAYLEAAAKESLDYEHCKCIGIRFMNIHINGGTVIASAKTSATKGSIAAISFSTESQAFPNLTYAEGLQPVVKAGKTETEAVEIESPNENTYANRWVKIQTRESNYTITVVPSEINFGTVKTGYAQPTPKTVTITNTGNETVELSKAVLQENSNYTVSGPSESRIAPRRTAEITVQPKDDLAAGEYNENLTISGSNKVSVSVELKFNVIKSGGGSSSGGGAVTPAPAPSDPDAEVITVKEDPKDDSTSKPGEESRTNTTTKTTVKNTTTETTKNEQGQDVSKSTASVSKELGDKLLDQAVSNNSDTIEITVKSNDKNDNNGGNAGGAGVADSVKSTEVKLPKATVDAIAKHTNADLVIKTDNSEVRLDNKTLETIADAAKGDAVTIVVGENTQLKETQKPAADIVGKNGSLFDFIAKIGERLLHQFEGGKVHVTLPMPEKLKDKDVLVIYIDDNGLCKILNHSVEKVGADDYIKFTTTHFSTFAVVDKDEAEQLIKEQNASHVKKLMQNAKFKVTTTKTSKKSVKVRVTAKNNKTLISDIKSMGYTVKYQFYRSTKKSAGYKLLKTKATSTFTNTKGSKGTKYYYKARVLIYDGKTLIAKSGLKACSWGSRVWNK